MRDVLREVIGFSWLWDRKSTTADDCSAIPSIAIMSLEEMNGGGFKDSLEPASAAK
jgi:hypothetical protein